MHFVVPADLSGPEHRDTAVNILANVISCVLDEALLARVGTFQWSFDHDVPSPFAVPVNRYERAATHLWHTVFGHPGLAIPDDDVERLFYLLQDCFKSASRCHAGNVRDLMNQSQWHRLMNELRLHLEASGKDLPQWLRS